MDSCAAMAIVSRANELHDSGDYQKMFDYLRESIMRDESFIFTPEYVRMALGPVGYKIEHGW